MAASYRDARLDQWRVADDTRDGGSTTTAPPSGGGSVGGSVGGPSCTSTPGRLLLPSAPNSLPLGVSLRLSGAKNESWKKFESCHSVARSRRRLGVAETVATSRRGCAGGAAGCGPRDDAALCGTSNCSSGIDGM